ncbi:MAG: DUF3566 domain-containing protein [Jatrophihabitantaceae bacterium]
MTQSPYRGTASHNMQSTTSTGSSTGTDSSRGGPGAKPGTDFGATTVSGAPNRNPQNAGGAQPDPGRGQSPYLQQQAQQQAQAQQRSQTATQARPTPAPSGARAPRNRGPRRARLQLRHISPLTVLKFSCVLAIALFFVWLIVVGVLYGVLDAAGVIQNVNDTVVQLNGSGSKAPITSGIVFGGAAIVGVVNIVLFVALTTIGSVIYNLCADLVGGIEITLSER